MTLESVKRVPEPCLRTWYYEDRVNGNRVISLHSTSCEDKFEFRITNQVSQEIKKDIIEVASEAIQNLVCRWDPILNAEGLIDYEHLSSQSYDGWDETVFSESKDETIRLGSKELAGNELLIWRLINKTTNVASWICASEICGRTVLNIERASVSLSRETFKAINKTELEKISSEAEREVLCDKILKAFTDEYPDEKIAEIYRSALKYQVARSSVGKLISVDLKFPSKYDPKRFIDTERWAITLLSTGSSSGHMLQRFGGHAMLFYEGGDKATGLPFRKYAHLFRSKDSEKSTPKVRFRDVHYIKKTEEGKKKAKNTFYLPVPIFIYECERQKDIVHERKRSRTFFLSSEQAVKMINKITKDVEKSPENTSALNFSPIAPLINSIKSITALTIQRKKGTLEENCLSYAVDCLREAGIYLPEPGGKFSEPDNYIQHLEADFDIEESSVGHFIAYQRSGKSRIETDADEVTRAALKFLMGNSNT